MRQFSWRGVEISGRIQNSETLGRPDRPALAAFRVAGVFRVGANLNLLREVNILAECAWRKNLVKLINSKIKNFG
jgi:hypothetical protein